MRNSTNPAKVIVHFCWTLILVLFMALTIFVNVYNGTYQNTWNDLTKQEVEETEQTEHNSESEVNVDVENGKVTIEE